ncbi:MAG: VanR-ABDEGLN family response regulator transcription factor [Erysipelotrichales bacterium]
MKNIVLVEDEVEIAQLLMVYLKNEGYHVNHFIKGNEAIEYINSNEVDLALLDVMLPDMSGFDILRTVRESYSFPIIMLTARVEDIDIINGLTIGADDYITKPFNPLEVIARIKSQFRRAGVYHKEKSNQIDIRGLLINLDTHQIFLYDKEIEFTPIEFKIIYHLASNKGKVISSEQLFEAIWKEKFFDNNNTVMAHIARIREKLNDSSKNPKFIKTVWGVGYKIEE